MDLRELTATERLLLRKEAIQKAKRKKAAIMAEAYAKKQTLKQGQAQTQTQTQRKCARCKQVQPLENFGHKHGFLYAVMNGLHPEERQTYCNECKKITTTKTMQSNTIVRVRHHTLTRIMSQLQPDPPEDINRRLEWYLGYELKTLQRHIEKDIKVREGITAQEAYKRGYHLDHIVPLHSFQHLIVDHSLQEPKSLEAFRECWDYKNLRLISAQENLAKGGKHLHEL